MNMAIATTTCPKSLTSFCDVWMFIFSFYHMLLSWTILMMFTNSKFCNVWDIDYILSISLFTIVLYINTLFTYIL